MRRRDRNKIPEFMLKQREAKELERVKRKQNLKEIELKHIETSLAKREEVQTTKPKLKSVHEGLEDTKSKEHCSNRKNKPTEAELLVQKYLKWVFGERFVATEFPIKNDYSYFIIDCYIPKHKLCVEVDGGYHSTPTKQWQDSKRDEWLLKNGYKVLRFTNEEVMNCTYKQFKTTIKNYVAD